MNSLFDTPADKLPQELQVLREVLWRSWENEPLLKSAWLNQMRVRACPEPAAAFRAFVEAGVLVKVGEEFKLDKDA